MTRRLFHSDGRQVEVGDSVTGFRGEHATVVGWQEPRHAGSTGRVYVREGTYESSYYPSVYNLKWKEQE